jgi:UDP-N-acetyl-D-galactosamine dehydrogenase
MIVDMETPLIGVIGLGYVGLPLAIAFSSQHRTIGLDISQSRIDELLSGHDSSLEVSDEELANAHNITYTAEPGDLVDCNIFIVTVPTPIDTFKRPDLGPLTAASRTVGKLLGEGNIVIYESTVYPGCTEEICVPILEENSGLRLNEDFYVGYSPERINPGDKDNRLATIVKVTSGSTAEAADFIDRLYKGIIDAGTHRASSIRVAEAAKVIENTQRDVNIALINELSLIFNKLGIDTVEVLEAAGSKWNFLPFRPGLVGGHCIGVDPYYLTHKAQEIGYHPEVILAGRRINDNMGAYVAERVIKLMTQRRIPVADANILILGLAFKENCPDLRNTRVTDIIAELYGYGAHVDVHDPWVSSAEALHEYDITLTTEPKSSNYDAVILAVAHRQFREMGSEGIRSLCKPQAILYDVKSALPANEVDGRL